MSKGEDAGRTLLDTGGTAHAFGIFHGQALVREVHDIDSLMTDRGTDVARDAFLFFGKNPVAREAGVDVHEGRERAGKAAPNTPAKPKVEADTENAAHEDVNAPRIV